MSRMITRSLSGINMKKPIQANQPKPVAKNLKTSTKLKKKPANQKIAATSQVKQANDASMSLLKPRISIASESTKSFLVADLNIMKPSQVDCQGTSMPVLKVLPMRRQTTESGFEKRPISSRRQTVSTTTPGSITTVRRSERIRLNESKPIYFPSRNSRYQKPAIHSFPVDIPKVNKKLPLTSTTKISKRRYTESASNERKEPTEAQPKTAAKRKLAVDPIAVENPKVNESLPSTSTAKISKRRYTEFASNEGKEPTEAQPKAAAKRKLAVDPIPVENPKVNESLPSTSTAKISKRRYTEFASNEGKEPTEAQPKAAAKRKLAVDPIPVENPKVNESLPSTSTRKISTRRYTKSASNERKEPTEAQPKAAAKRKLAVDPIPVENPKVNESLPSTSTAKISNRRKTIFVSKQYKEPTDAQPKTVDERKVRTPTPDHPSPVEISEVNENMPSTSATKISMPALPTTVDLTPIPKKATGQMSAVDTSALKIRKEYENLPSTSMTAISKQRTTVISKELKEPTTFSPLAHSTPIGFPKKTPNQMSANHRNSNEIPKLNENLPSTSEANIPTRLSPKAARKSTVPSGLSEIPNGNTPSTSNVMANGGKIEIIIPNELKTLLVDDIKRVREGKEYKIPATQNVAKIIELYVELKPTVRNYENSFGFTFKQIFDNVLEYFDTLLGELLYESERIRYLDMLNNFPGEKMSTLYPPIYLLRLFVKLNSLLQFSCRDKDTLRYVVNYLNEFAQYLAENKSIFCDMNIFC